MGTRLGTPHPLANFQSSSLCRLHVFNFHTAILTCVVDNVFIIFFSQISEYVQVFFFFRIYFFTFYFSALPWWSNDSLMENLHFVDRPASSMSKFSVAVNSDLGNGPVWVEIRDAIYVDQCSSISTRVWLHQLTADLKRCLLFWICLQWSCIKEVSVPSFVVGCLRVPPRRALLSGVCHRGHYKALSRCRLVGSCVCPGENFFQ